MDTSALTTADLQKQIEKYRRLLQEQEKSARLLIRRDLELSEANERLRTLDRMKTDFVSVATHQLRTPLSAIRWTLSMLLKGDLGPLNDEQRAFIMKTYESNNRMITLLGDMLFSDRIDSGKLPLAKIPVSLPDLVDNLLLEMRPIAAKKQIAIEFPQSGASMTPVHLDPRQMRAVFQNLIENAIKYSKSGGVIRITLAPNAAHMIITIEDHGIGIPPDQQKDVFTRFFRARNAIKVETDGSGLGLFIAKSIIERNGGTISFESVENEGTIFRLEVPNTS